jgi:hypothetical protein
VWQEAEYWFDTTRATNNAHTESLVSDLTLWYDLSYGFCLATVPEMCSEQHKMKTTKSHVWPVYISLATVTAEYLIMSCWYVTLFVPWWFNSWSKNKLLPYPTTSCKTFIRTVHAFAQFVVLSLHLLTPFSASVHFGISFYEPPLMKRPHYYHCHHTSFLRRFGSFSGRGLPDLLPPVFCSLLSPSGSVSGTNLRHPSKQHPPIFCHHK